MIYVLRNQKCIYRNKYFFISAAPHIIFAKNFLFSFIFLNFADTYMRHKRFIVLLLTALCFTAHADASGEVITNDSSFLQKGLIGKVYNYFSRTNEEDKNKKFDVSFIGGPRYSSDKKFGIAALAAGLYSTDRKDSTLMKSDVALLFDCSTVGYWSVELYGNHIFPHDRFRMVYNIETLVFPSYTWGIGYDMCSNDDNKTKMKRMQVNMHTSFLVHITDDFFAGPFLSYDYINCNNPHNPDILPDLDRVTSNIGIGVTAVYDSRDVITNPHKGYFLSFTQCFRPKLIGNDYAFSTTEFAARFYRPVWKGGIIAGDINGMFNFGTTPWGMLAQVGGSHSMRGYYEGRYRDKHKMECQLELRQHLWGRNGMVAWIGAGSVFDKFSAITMKKILPNCGIGYRWEFKKDVNLRLDCGLGKAGQSGVMFSVNEAF